MSCDVCYIGENEEGEACAYPFTYIQLLPQGNVCQEIELFVCQGSTEPSCGRETLSHRLSAYRAPIIFQVLCHRNGHWKWLDAVHVRQISCLFTVPDTFSVCREEKCEFQKGTHSTESDRHQVNPLNSTEGSSSLRSPVTESLPNNKKPYLLWFCSNKHNNTCSTRLPFQA